MKYQPGKPGLILFVGMLTVWLAIGESHAQTKNGFDLSDALIPPEDMRSGGPPRDGIPSIDDPKFLEAGDAGYLDADDRILGVTKNDIAKAYPIRVMNWHEIVNDRFGETPVAVTYCPLCGSGVAYNARVAGEIRTFGVSGLLYNNDVLLYDRESESLWSQLMNKAIAGPLKSTELQPVRMVHTTWSAWRTEHPESLVLSRETGFDRDYAKSPYAGYAEKPGTIFPVTNTDNRLPTKALVLGVEIDGKYKAYPFRELDKAGPTVRDEFNGSELIISYHREHRSARLESPREGEVHSLTLYWFAWAAFHPETAVFRSH